MFDVEPLDRCAAYVATRTAYDAMRRASPTWPPQLAEQAKQAALEAITTTAESFAFGHATAARRRCVRSALASAVELAAVCDVVHALGDPNADLDEVQRCAGRSIAMLGLLFNANANRFNEA